MADFPVEEVQSLGNGTLRVSWYYTGIFFGADKLGEAFATPGRPSATLHMHGDFAGGSGRLEGSDDNIDFRTLSDPVDNPVSAVTEAIFEILEAPGFVRPVFFSAIGGGTVEFNLVLRTRRTP